MNDAVKGDRETRRQFLSRCTKAGLSIAAACSVGYGFYEASEPKPFDTEEKNIRLPDYSIQGKKEKIAVVAGRDRIKTVNMGFKALGGIESFIQKGDHVLIKVNAAFATPPILSATTSPELLGEVVRLCLKAGAEKVKVTDNPINDPASCFTLTGIESAAKSAGAEIYLPKNSYFKPITIEGAQLIKNWPLLFHPFKGVNKVIGMAPVKDHHRSGASMAMKNWYGILGGRRNVFHQDIHNIIKELAMMVTPTLVILDGTVTMMTNGPTGGSLSDLKQTDTMIISTDQVAADSFGATLLGKDLNELPFIKKAQEAGAGNADFKSLNPVMISAG
ncbi:MAG: DUF362 domain-containing protein [Desulfobacterales bacterium]